VTGQLRITGGSLARRRIDVPAAADKGLVRPTSDKVREALFSSLASRVQSARVLDVFAGSGALGFEALSRGAASATFIERDPKTAATLAENARALGLEERCDVVIQDAPRALAALVAMDARFEVIVCDPPYARTLDDVAPHFEKLLAPAGVLVVERAAADPAPVVSGLSVSKQRVYGDTTTWTFSREGARPDQRGNMASAAIYPGSFDPLTNGHVDIIERGLRTFDKVIVAVANNVQKTHLFSIEERVALARQSLAHLTGVEIDTFDGLVVDYAKKSGVRTLLRGLRAVSDFEYELQLASMNRKLVGEVETVFMMTSEELFYVSSKLVREVATFGGDITQFVPAPIASALVQKLASKAKK
jgi:pantetheine-phosphate adenylyltransferase